MAREPDLRPASSAGNLAGSSRTGGIGAGIAPVLSATVGSATLAWFGIQSQSFATAWPLWWIGDATGVLIVAPLALVVFQNWRAKAQLSAARWIEACVLGLIFLAVAALSLSGYLPFAYIIMPPLLWAAVRFEFKGAAVTLTLLALVTAIFTTSGASQFAGNPEAQKHLAGHAAAVSGRLGIFRAHRGRDIPAIPACGDHVAAKRAVVARTR